MTRPRPGPGQAPSTSGPRTEDLLKEIIGRDAALRETIRLAVRIAPEPIDVLILGETGTGKENLARLVHAASGRTGPFVAVNCACLSRELGLAELFGHTKGAFTGASVAREGLFQRAAGGTLFLDEIGELPAEVQASLLRALQERVVRPVGSLLDERIDVRVVSATHRDLPTLSAAGSFRADLYHRLAGFPLRLPPLRERGSDVVIIAKHLLKADPICRRSPTRLSRDACTLMQGYPWPGNIRELLQTLRRVALSHEGAIIDGPRIAHALGIPRGSIDRPDDVPYPERILAIFTTRERLGIGEIVARVALSRATTLRALRALVASGKLLRVGDGRGTMYHIPCVDPAPTAQPPDRPDESAAQPLTPREVRVLELAARRHGISRGDLCRALHLAPRSATRLLVELSSKGLLISQGDSARNRTYALASSHALTPSPR